MNHQDYVTYRLVEGASLNITGVVSTEVIQFRLRAVELQLSLATINVTQLSRVT